MVIWFLVDALTAAVQLWSILTTNWIDSIAKGLRVQGLRRPWGNTIGPTPGPIRASNCFGFSNASFNDVGVVEKCLFSRQGSFVKEPYKG
jgi:hypothetical protein